MSTPDHTQPPQHGSPGPQTTWGHDEPPRRSWFARHKIITGILVVLGLFIIIGALGGDEDSADGAAQPSATSTGSAEEGAGSSASSSGSTADESAAEDSAEQPAETEDSAEPASEESEQPAVPGLNEVVTVGEFAVTVTGTEGGLAQVGDDMFGEEAQGQFVKVLVTVENTGDAAEYFLDSEQKLIDDSDRQHSTSSASYLLDEESLFLTEINPGNTVEGVLLYDIPEDAVPTSIDLQGGIFGSPVRVALEG